ncbi:protein of unknown function [Candidatus Filomicrobium marinum]|uniref:Uncharacterized protein n=1 Tax=Candidatus Filomicrobium marinum TaxID=1608628 RepID=A0A0D6JCF7_9HYPH|nr:MULTISPECIES: hypothetical protein [Filomicrobium]MCV0371824.1 hypothetical protein [Filomicrobium sp.]CFX05593.1 protein of unknown function [Candidatus Filomicrobium marinum]CPR16269.1 protein of unknown function [Candidatus Filomicrobium marinum]
MGRRSSFKDLRPGTVAACAMFTLYDGMAFWRSDAMEVERHLRGWARAMSGYAQTPPSLAG